MKVDKDKNEIVGLSLKYDKLMPSEITQLLASDKRLKRFLYRISPYGMVNL